MHYRNFTYACTDLSEILTVTIEIYYVSDSELKTYLHQTISVFYAI